MTTLLERVSGRYAGVAKEAGPVGLKAVTAEVSYNPSAAIVTAVANTAAVDQADEVVVPEGAEMGPNGGPRYMAEMRAIYYNHDYDQLPIASFVNARLTPKGWVTQFKMTGKTPLSRDLTALFALGDDNPVRGVSIGFVRTQSGEPTEDEVGKYGPHSWITRKWIWLELSVTPMPCNPEAMISGVAMPTDETIRRIEALATKRVITTQTARLLGVPEPRKIVRVQRVVTVGS